VKRDVRFTGERLHAGDDLFSVDLARHRAAYEVAAERRAGANVLDLGCGSGHGAAWLATNRIATTGVDRVPPDASARASGADFLLADIAHLPFTPASFDTIVSFQVIEHLPDPGPYLRSIARLLRPRGIALLTTPNRGTSDGVNPYHVREYLSAELRSVLASHFAEVEVLGIGMSEPVRAYMAARSVRIQRIMRLDPLGIRDRLPRVVVERLFAWGARLVRRRTHDHDGAPVADARDFPVGVADDATSLDWLALCRAPHGREAPVG
jgi:SAM-dependent methyltransferase